MTNLKNINKNAIQSIEAFVISCNPKEKQDLKIITQELATVAIGAMLAVHNLAETIKYLNHIKTFICDTVSSNVTIH